MTINYLLILFLSLLFNLFKFLLLSFTFFQLISKLLKSFLLQLHRSCISFIVSLSIPIITLYLSSIEKSTIHDRYAALCIFFSFEFYLNYTIRMSFIESYSLYLALSCNLICNIFFN